MTSGRDSSLDAVLTAEPKEAWGIIFDRLWEIFAAPLTTEHAENEIIERERRISALELILSGSSWNLWSDFEKCVPRAAPSLVDFWNSTQSGKAVLILDGLSLREMPWLVEEAKRRGYVLQQSRVRGSEIPSDTTPFAKALGFSQRSALQNNGAGRSHKLKGAVTEVLSAAWEYCMDWASSAPDVCLWHQWPDDRIHQLAEPGDGFQRLCRDAAEQLTSDAFWKMIDGMTTGRRMVITSDHGYAASGMFADVSDKEQVGWLKATFGSSRFAHGPGSAQHWVPPNALSLTTAKVTNPFALGRRKWKSAGGYPTLAHGGLSLLEVTVPFIEISKA